jgi:hypothetical protein
LDFEAVIVLSSFRPFREDPEWDRNQLAAFRTWMMFAQRIVLFGQQEAELMNKKVVFIQSEQWPKIKAMVDYAASQKNQFVCICNGDIMLDPKILRIEQRMKFSNYRCASSRRWHFDPSKPMQEAITNASLTDMDGRDDRGRDVFIARWDVWARIAKETPDKLRIGHNTWDAFLTDKFREHWDDKFIDFTAFRYVHHPHHGGRRRPHELEVAATA